MLWINIVESLEQIWENKLRSFTNIIGIIIGICSTILLVAITTSFSAYVSDFLLSMDSNSVWILPDRRQEHFNKRVELTQKDIDSILELPIIDKLTPNITRNVHIKYGNKEITTSITGTNTEFQEIRNYYVDVGRFFSSVEEKNRKQVCVLGRDILEQLEVNEDIVGQNIYIDKNRYRVIGLLEKKGSFFGINQDNVVIMPCSVLNKLYPFTRYSMAFTISVDSPDKINSAKEQISEVLRRRHKILPGDVDDFRIFSQDSIVKEFEKANKIAVAVLCLICGISLTISSISLMNTMFCSIRERIYEIGIRRCVGATNTDILFLFLSESVVLSLIGGLFGIILGYILAYLVNFYPDLIITIHPPFYSVILGFVVSFGVGIISGIFPAFQAAKMTVISAINKV